MSDLFAILFLISLILMVWGLIAPQHFTRYTKGNRFGRKNALIRFGLLALVFFVLVGITASSNSSTANIVSVPPGTDKQPLAQTQPPAPATGQVTTNKETETQPIAYSTQKQSDSSLAQGQTKITQQGKDGVETLTYDVTYTGGKQTDKTLVSKDITTPPVDQIVSVGTYVVPLATTAPTSTTPVPQSTSCYPLTNGGNCYKAGEYCRIIDHNTTGVASNGTAIICTDNNGWRWEPR